MDKYILQIFSTVQPHGAKLSLDKTVITKLRHIITIIATVITGGVGGTTLAGLKKNITKEFPKYLVKHVVKAGESMKHPIIPVGQVKKYFYGSTRQDTSLFLIGVLEYIVAEILELSSLGAMNRNSKTVLEYDLYQTIESDEELLELFKRLKIHVKDSNKIAIRKTSAKKAVVRKTTVKKLSSSTTSVKKAAVRKPFVKKVTKKQLTEMTVVELKKYMDSSGIKPKTGTKAQLISRIISGKTTAKKSRKTTVRKTAVRKTAVRKTTARKANAKKTKKQLTEMTVVALKKYMDTHGIKPKTGKKAQLINRIIKA